MGMTTLAQLAAGLAAFVVLLAVIVAPVLWSRYIEGKK